MDEFDEEEVQAHSDQLPVKNPQFDQVRLSEFISMDLGDLKITKVTPPTGKRRRSGGGEGNDLLRMALSNNDPSLPSISEGGKTSNSDPGFRITREDSDSFLEPGLDSQFHWQRHRDSIKVLKVLEHATAQTNHRTIVFVRSGKSVWNDQTRTGFMNKIGAFAKGFMENRNPENQSQILDAPLSEKGIIQAKKLSKFMQLQKLKNAHVHVEKLRLSLIEQLQESLVSLKKREREGESTDREGDEYDLGLEKLKGVMQNLKRLDENILLGDQPPLRANFSVQDVYHTLLFDHQHCVITASNLRRSLQTATISLHERFVHTADDPSEDAIYTLSCLQEVIQNYDNQPLPAGAIGDSSPILSPLMVAYSSDADQLEQDCSARINSEFNYGDVSAMDKSDRFKEYLEWVFDTNDQDTVVTFGHGRWFQEFFREMIPPQPKDNEKDVDKVKAKITKKRNLAADLRKKKLEDCAAVAFSLYKIIRPNASEAIYSLPTSSLKLIYGDLTRA